MCEFPHANQLRNHVAILSQAAAPNDERFNQVIASITEFARVTMFIFLVFFIAAVLQVLRIREILLAPGPFLNEASANFNKFDAMTFIKAIGWSIIVYFSRTKGTNVVANPESSVALPVSSSGSGATSDRSDAPFLPQARVGRRCEGNHGHQSWRNILIAIHFHDTSEYFLQSNI